MKTLIKAISVAALIALSCSPAVAEKGDRLDRVFKATDEVEPIYPPFHLECVPYHECQDV